MIFWRPPGQVRVKANQVQVFGDGLSHGQSGDELHFQIKSQTPNVQGQFSPTSCKVTFEGPSKPEIKFETATDNTVNCAWLPKLPGQYKITIKYNGDQVIGSPFVCNVSGGVGGQQLQAQQLAKIVCSGAGLHSGRVQEMNQVKVNEVNGMIGGLSVSMEGPGKPVIKFHTNSEDGSLSMFYQVPVAGVYTLNVKFMGEHVNGSPFRIHTS